tara:strand:+ start:236 stop:523 length:288 start_codon:yes stop_codon:yes gene_type:complete
MATQKNIQKAINLLAVEQDSEIRWSFSHIINNQTDLDNINVEDDKAFTFTFADVQTKADEIEAEEEVKKDNKLSAYRKLSMTDDEIREIDPTLLA